MGLHYHRTHFRLSQPSRSGFCHFGSTASAEALCSAAGPQSDAHIPEVGPGVLLILFLVLPRV